MTVKDKGKRTKSEARYKIVRKPEALLKEGDWLDVMDGDGVWNVARVLNVPSFEEVEITYDGWTKEYDEIVRVNSDRVAPYHTFTWTVKCWVKYLNWPLWPSLITIRTPGTPDGIRNLEAENRLFVDFLDSPDFAERDRCWQKKQHVRSFDDNLDKERLESTGQQFERALELILQSDASTTMPKFAMGTLPYQYQSHPAEAVAAVRKKMGDVQWFQRFTINRMLHKRRHVYDVLGDGIDKEISNESRLSTQKKRRLNLSAITEKSQLQVKVKKKLPTITAESSECHEKIEFYCKVDQTDNIYNHDTMDNWKDDRQKRRGRPKRRTDNISKLIEVKPKQKKDLDSPKLAIASEAVARYVEIPLNGQTQMATRRSVSRDKQILTVSPGILSNDDEDETLNGYQSEKALIQHSRRAKTHDKVANSGEFILGSSTTLSKQAIKRQFSDTENKRHVVVKKRQQANYQVLTRKSSQLKRSISSTADPHKISQATESCRSVSRKAYLLPTSENAFNSCIETRMNTEKETRQRSVKLSSKESADESKNSKTSGSNNTNNRKIIKCGRDKSKKNVSRGEVDAIYSAVKVACDQKKHSKSQRVGKYVKVHESQPQRFCVMQAIKTEASSIDNRDNPRLSKKTEISMPRKFCVTAIPPACHTNNSMLHLAPPPRLCSSGRTCPALDSPYTAVFSSSKGFSIESWFKRKLMAESKSAE